VVGVGATILLLNIYAPSSSDVRVYKYTVPIVSQVRGRVVDVPVEEGNRLVKKGEVLFKVDPTPYDLDVKVLEAQLANTQAGQRELKESARGAAAKTAETRGAIAQAASRTREIDAKLALARAAVPRAGEERCRQPLRPRARRDRCERARGPARRRAQRRNPGARLGRAGGVGRAADRAEARCQRQRRIRAGRADPGAARERQMAPRPDHHALALQLLRDQPAAASGRLRRRPAGE